jgi:hypothetical protein
VRWHLNIMEYKGKLYAKIGNKYLEISHTDKFEQLEIEANYSDMLVKELEDLKKENDRKFKEWENQRITIKELQEENNFLKDREISNEKLEHFLEWVDDKTDFFENRDTAIGTVVNEYLQKI